VNSLDLVGMSTQGVLCGFVQKFEGVAKSRKRALRTVDRAGIV